MLASWGRNQGFNINWLKVRDHQHNLQLGKVNHGLDSCALEQVLSLAADPGNLTN